jgi:hypothetical protein
MNEFGMIAPRFANLVTLLTGLIAFAVVFLCFRRAAAVAVIP